MLTYQFAITPGVVIPRAHQSGYIFLSALANAFPQVHFKNREGLQVAPVISHTVTGGHRSFITDTSSKICLRGITPEEASVLQNGRLVVSGREIQMKLDSINLINAAPKLRSRLVVFDLDDVNPQAFTERVLYQVGGKCTLGNQHPFEMKGRMLLGYTLILEGLDDETSLRIQNEGLGKYTSMGCGVFAPIR